MKKIFWGAVIIGLLIIGYLLTDYMLFNGVKPQKIAQNGFEANYFVAENTNQKAAVVLIGGGDWGDYWGQEFAKKGYVGLSLPYLGVNNMPQLQEEVDVVYFEKALQWLKNQPEVDATKIVVMGASRNAELALIIAAEFPEIVSGVIGYSPSSVAWSNTVLPYSSAEIKASWNYLGTPIPYVAMDKLTGNSLATLETLAYWKNGLQKAEAVKQAEIEVEKINGPILLLSGIDDRVWPSCLMADMIEKRLTQNNFQFPFWNMQYENAGHLISDNPERNSDQRMGEMNIDGKVYNFEYGGTIDGDQKAKQDAKSSVFNFVEKM